MKLKGKKIERFLPGCLSAAYIAPTLSIVTQLKVTGVAELVTGRI